MTRYKFFQKILTQLEQIQTGLNTLRATMKEEIQNEAYTKHKEKESLQ